MNKSEILLSKLTFQNPPIGTDESNCKIDQAVISGCKQRDLSWMNFARTGGQPLFGDNNKVAIYLDSAAAVTQGRWEHYDTHTNE